MNLKIKYIHIWVLCWKLTYDYLCMIYSYMIIYMSIDMFLFLYDYDG